MSIERLPSSSFLPRQGLFYKDGYQLHPIFDKLAWRANLIISGPKGIAKSLSVASYAALRKVHIITYDCSEDARRSHLIGMHTIRGNETPFVLGPITTAFEVANDTGACILYLEEFSSLQPAQQRLFNPVTDWRCRIEVPECGKVFQLEKSAKLWVVASQNTATYAGTYNLNEDLKSRFRIIQLKYPSMDMEKEIVQEFLKHKGIAFEDTNLKNVLRLAMESRASKGGQDYPISTRDIVQTMEDISIIGVPASIKLLFGKFDGADRITFSKRINSIFGYEFSP